MRKTSIKFFSTTLVLGTFFGQALYAQKDTTALSPDGDNLLKVSITAPIAKNFSFQYERAIGLKMSAALTVHFMPKSDLPFKSTLKDLIDDDETWENVQYAKTGNFSIAPEIKSYMGKKGMFRGFYLAPFVKYASYTVDMPYTFSVTVNATNYKETIQLDGNINTFTGGLQLGAQWKLTKLIYLDWYIIGPNYGFSNGHIDGAKTLNSYEQQALKDKLEDLNDIPLVKTTSTVDGNGAKVDFNGPWAGLRGGVNIGFRF